MSSIWDEQTATRPSVTERVAMGLGISSQLASLVTDFALGPVPVVVWTCLDRKSLGLAGANDKLTGQGTISGIRPGLHCFVFRATQRSKLSHVTFRLCGPGGGRAIADLDQRLDADNDKGQFLPPNCFASVTDATCWPKDDSYTLTLAMDADKGTMWTSTDRALRTQHSEYGKPRQVTECSLNLWPRIYATFSEELLPKLAIDQCRHQWI